MHINQLIRQRRVYLPIMGMLLFAIGAGSLRTDMSHNQTQEGGFVTVSDLRSLPTLPDVTPAKANALPPVPAGSCAQNGTGKLLLVSISQQHIWACDGTNVANQSAVTTGASNAPRGIDDSTPTGTWRIYSKQTSTHLRGSDINGSWDAVQYWMPFDGQIGFHDASWQTFPFGSSQYQTDGSHGCVHLPADVAAWIYSWAPTGTTVTVEA